MSNQYTPSKKITGHLCAAFCALVWGSSFLVSRTLLTVLTAAQLALIRFILAYIMLWIIHPKWHFKWRDELRFLLFAIFANTLYFYCENEALLHTSAANVSILVTTAPLLTLLLMRMLKRISRISYRQLIGCAIAFVGVVLVVFNGTLEFTLHIIGDLLAVGAAICWAIYSIIADDLNQNFDSFLISRKLMFYGILTILPIVLTQGIDLAAIIPCFTVPMLLGLLYLSAVASSVCYVLWNKSISHLSVSVVNLYIYAIPVVTLLSDAIFFDESVSAMGLCGMICVIAGMLLS